jgi:hypothetical protein
MSLLDISFGHQPWDLQVRMAHVGLEEVDYVAELRISDRRNSVPSLFYCRIATVDALAAGRRQRDPFASTNEEVFAATRATIVVARPAWDSVRSYVEKTVASVSGSTLPEAADELQQYFVWEYDDYGMARDSIEDRAQSYLELAHVELTGGGVFRSLYPSNDEEVDYDVVLTTRHRSGDEERFEVRIVTPGGLAAARRNEAACGSQFDRELVIAHCGTLVVKYFDWREVLDALRRLVRACGAEASATSTWRLRRFFRSGGPHPSDPHPG